MFTIIASAPESLDAIKPDEIYEYQVFSIQDYTEIHKIWRIRAGVITERGPHNGKKVVQFIARKDNNPRAHYAQKGTN